MPNNAPIKIASKYEINRFNNEFVDNLNTLKEKRKKLVKKISDKDTLSDIPLSEKAKIYL